MTWNWSQRHQSYEIAFWNINLFQKIWNSFVHPLTLHTEGSLHQKFTTLLNVFTVYQPVLRVIMLTMKTSLQTHKVERRTPTATWTCTTDLAGQFIMKEMSHLGGRTYSVCTPIYLYAKDFIISVNIISFESALNANPRVVIANYVRSETYHQISAIKTDIKVNIWLQGFVVANWEKPISLYVLVKNLLEAWLLFSPENPPVNKSTTLWFCIPHRAYITTSKPKNLWYLLKVKNLFSY